MMAGITKRSAGLDVVRSTAILGVLLGHCGGSFASWSHVRLPWQLAAAGFYGVELFFVLSGFLIGRLLIDILDRGPTMRRWIVFLIRRWMRTLPLYYLWVFILAFAWPPHFAELANGIRGQELPYYLALAQNMHGRVIGTWFAVSWSLTVEEWFYLLFSSALFIAAALFARRIAFWLTAAAFIVVPLALRWHLPDFVDWNQVTSKAVIYRLDAIALGAVVAWMQVRQARLMRYPRLLLGLGLFIIFMTWEGQDLFKIQVPTHIRETIIFDVVSFGFCLCLPAAAAMRGSGTPALTAIVRALSGQSYAMYIIHLPMIELSDYYRARSPVPLVMIEIWTMLEIYVLSYLTYRFFEKPILAIRPAQYGTVDRAGA